MPTNESNQSIILYEGKDGNFKLEVHLENETVWLSQKQMAELFDVEVATINEHLKNIYKSEELSDVSTIRNFLTVQKEGNRVVSAFFDLAEIKAQEHHEMKMKDWIFELDKFTTMYGKGTLEDGGNITHDQAIEKATKEYRTYQAKTLSPVEKSYLESIKAIQKIVEKKTNQKKSEF